MPNIEVRHLGDYIREQRATSQISLRQLAKLAGVSNPYLSQIERGLRRPSAEILQQIAKGLRVSAEVLYVQAGILEQRAPGGLVVDAVLLDEALSERQKQVLVEIYDSFRKENAASALVLKGAEAAAAQPAVTADGQQRDAAVGGRPAGTGRARKVSPAAKAPAAGVTPTPGKRARGKATPPTGSAPPGPTTPTS